MASTGPRGPAVLGATGHQGGRPARGRFGGLGARAAEVYSHGARPPRKFDTSGLIRGYRAAAAAITAAIGATQADLDLASTGGQQ